MIRVAILLLVALGASAGEVICDPAGLKVPCTPPAMWTTKDAPTPFDAPMRFGREVVIQGRVHWIYLKAGEPPRPCSAQEASNGPSYRRACAAMIGDEFTVTLPFRVEVTP